MYAQFATGQKVIGGNVSFSTCSSNSTQIFDNRIYHNSGTSIGINPSIGKFYTPTSLRGIGIIYNYNNNNNYSTEDTTANRNGYKNFLNSAGLNIFSQHFISLSSNLFFTIQTSALALYSFCKLSDLITTTTTKNKAYGISAALAPGISYKLNSRILFDAYFSNLLSVGYTYSTTVTNYPLPKETKTHGNSFNISSSLSNTNLGNIGLGFRWLLKRS